MNDKFDELAKNLAQSVTRRGALREFGIGLAGLALASLGLSSSAGAPGAYTCCTYRCDTLSGPSHFKVCEPPGMSCPPILNCSLEQARSAPGCAHCK